MLEVAMVSGGSRPITASGRCAPLPAYAPAMPESKPVPRPGTIIDGRYRVVQLVGEGGMGKVYLAEHLLLSRAVALKLLDEHLAQYPDLVTRFLNEARASSSIGHEHVVDVLDFGYTGNGSAFIAMEYRRGKGEPLTVSVMTDTPD